MSESKTDKLDFKKFWKEVLSVIFDWNVWLKLVLIAAIPFVCFILAFIIYSYYPRDWMISGRVMSTWLFGSLWFLIMFLSTMLFITLQIRYKYRFSNVQYVLLTYSTVTYLFLRFYTFPTGGMILDPILEEGCLNNFRFLDLPFLLISISIIASVIRDFKTTRSNQENNHFIEDKPLSGIALDQFDTTIRKIEPVLFTDSYERAFAVGLVGAWGTGKTSLLNAIERRITEHKGYEKKHIFMRFSPFQNHNEDRVIHEFFVQLSNVLGKRSGALSNSLIAYSEKLSDVVEGGSILSLINPTASAYSEESVGELYTSISEVIESLNLKIIVSVDDLDRLSAMEILQVLKLIRNTSNFPNMVFLVSMDREYVVRALSESNEFMSAEYIDKFFQLELYVPHMEGDDIVENLLIQLEALKSRPAINQFAAIIDGLISAVKKTSIYHRRNLSNYRDVNNLINQIIGDLSFLNEHKKQVNLQNYLLLLQIKRKYPSVFSILCNQPELFLEERKDRRWTLNAQKVHSLWDEDVDLTEESKEKIRHHLFDGREWLLISESRFKKLLDLLRELFSPEDIPNNSVMYRDKFQLITAYRVIDEVFSRSDLIDLINQETFDKSRVDEILKKHYGYFDRKVVHFVPTNNEELKRFGIFLFRLLNETDYPVLPLLDKHFGEQVNSLGSQETFDFFDEHFFANDSISIENKLVILLQQKTGAPHSLSFPQSEIELKALEIFKDYMRICLELNSGKNFQELVLERYFRLAEVFENQMLEFTKILLQESKVQLSNILVRTINQEQLTDGKFAIEGKFYEFLEKMPSLSVSNLNEEDLNKEQVKMIKEYMKFANLMRLIYNQTRLKFKFNYLKFESLSSELSRNTGIHFLIQLSGKINLEVVKNKKVQSSGLNYYFPSKEGLEPEKPIIFMSIDDRSGDWWKPFEYMMRTIKNEASSDGFTVTDNGREYHKNIMYVSVKGKKVPIWKVVYHTELTNPRDKFMPLVRKITL